MLVPRLYLRDPGPLQGLPLQGSKFGDILQVAPTQSQAQSSNEDPEPPQIEDVFSEGEISDSDQENPHSGTSVLNQLFNTADEYRLRLLPLACGD